MSELFLHDSRWSGDWQLWLSDVVPGLHIDSSGSTFSLYSLALHEAQNGAGILMGHEPLVRSSFADGSLIAPFKQVFELSRKLVVSTPYPLRKGTLLEKIVAQLSDDV